MLRDPRDRDLARRIWLDSRPNLAGLPDSMTWRRDGPRILAAATRVFIIYTLVIALFTHRLVGLVAPLLIGLGAFWLGRWVLMRAIADDEAPASLDARVSVTALDDPDRRVLDTGRATMAWTALAPGDCLALRGSQRVMRLTVAGDVVTVPTLQV